MDDPGCPYTGIDIEPYAECRQAHDCECSVYIYGQITVWRYGRQYDENGRRNLLGDVDVIWITDLVLSGPITKPPRLTAQRNR